jgi:hypothetical protein
MIRCTIELIPHGNEKYKESIGIIEIVNDGSGNFEYGNYMVFIRNQKPYTKISIDDLKKMMIKKEKIDGIILGKVKKFKRINNIYELLIKSLKSCGFK